MNMERVVFFFDDYHVAVCLRDGAKQLKSAR